MITKIYDQHDAAFAQVSAFVILKAGKRVATVALKFPRDGAGRLYAYVHWFGTEMVRGYASGGGYDKRSAACADASTKPLRGMPQGEQLAFWSAMSNDDGSGWDRRLQDAGFTVLQAV